MVIDPIGEHHRHRLTRRALQLGLGSAAMLAAGAASASATTIRQGTATTAPTSASPILASGTAVRGDLSAPANFQTPTTVGSCSSGAFRATIGTNPGSPASLTTGSQPSTRLIRTCTDNNPSYDVVSLELSNAPTLAVANSSAGGTVTIPSSVTFRLVWQSGGTFTPCSFVPVGPTPIVGAFTNSTGLLAFSNVRLRTTASTGLCATEFGNSNVGTTNNSVFSFAFKPLRTVPASGTGNLLGIFA